MIFVDIRCNDNISREIFGCISVYSVTCGTKMENVLNVKSS